MHSKLFANTDWCNHIMTPKTCKVFISKFIYKEVVAKLDNLFVILQLTSNYCNLTLKLLALCYTQEASKCDNTFHILMLNSIHNITKFKICNFNGKLLFMVQFI
jgi:hypothetical protein